MDRTGTFHGRYNGILGIFNSVSCGFKGVSSFVGVSKVFRSISRDFRGLSKVFSEVSGDIKVVSKAFQGLLRAFHGCFGGVLGAFKRRSMGISKEFREL